MFRVKIKFREPSLVPQLSERPRLAVPWSGGWEDFLAKLNAVRTRLPILPRELALTAFRDAAVEPDWPGRALVASLGFHLVAVLIPLPEFLTRPNMRPAAPETTRIELDLKWMGTSRVLPPISPRPRPQRQPSPGGEENQPLPPPGADRLQPQTIVSNPAEPNHPTQTLLQQFALDTARVQVGKLRLPNMVIPPAPAPAQEIDLRRLRLPNAPLDLTGPPQIAQPERPKTNAELALENAKLENMLPRLTLPAASPGDGTGSAPEMSAAEGVARSGDLTAPGLIALSADPAAPSPVVELPDTNLRARFVAGPFPGNGSPGGVPGGVPGASGGSGGGPGGEGGGPAGLSAPEILVTPAGPVPSGPVIVGPAAGVGEPPAPAPAPAASTEEQRAERRPGPQAQSSKPPDQRAEEILEGISPGGRPGTGAGGRRVYTIYINMPNLTSQTGSWVLRFAELGEGSRAAAGGASDTAPLAAPVALKKVDPRYPAAARQTGIEGIVFLYGVIREDGTVDNVQVVRGLHTLLDQSAVDAFQRWRFQPGQKNGAAVNLEVVVEIPFRLTKLF